MIIFLYGHDSYRRQKKQQWVVAEYRTKHSTATIERFDIEIEDGGVSWGRLRDFIKNQSLFDLHKLAIVRGIYAIADNKEQVRWLTSLRDAPGIVILIVADNAPPKKLSFLIEKPTVYDKFILLDGFALKQFVEMEAAHRGAHLSELQFAKLSALYRNDLWGLVTELDKLVLMPSAKRKAQSVFFMRDFFSLVKTLAYGRKNEKLFALEELLRVEDSAKTFNMLAALVFGVEKVWMADYDVAVKSGALDYETALLDFAIR